MHLKAIVLGDEGVGKTSFVMQCCGGEFGHAKPTVFLDFMMTDAVDENGGEHKVAFWDPSGKEAIRRMVPSYIRNAWLAFVLYDCQSRKSFESVDYWVSTIREERGENVVIYVIGNKCEGKAQEVLNAEGEQLAERLDVMFMPLTSTRHLGPQRVLSNALSHVPYTPEPVCLESSGEDLEVFEPAKNHCCSVQ